MKSVVLVLLLASSAFSWKHFHNGRLRGGNLQLESFERSTRVQELYFDQKLDHYDPTNTLTWQQRYFVNDQYVDEAKKNVFLMIGGEGEASVAWMTNGAWIKSAEKYKALCFQLEHRFYGKSHPTEDLSTENLRFLTSQQALADLANFIESMNQNYNLPGDVKWIVFGGSYPGSLAAWLRLQYPHLVSGAMSASGPLLAQVDFQDYMRVIREDLRTHSQDCVDSVQSAVKELEENLNNPDLNKLFKLCSSISDTSSKDIDNLFEAIADNFAGIAQYNNDNRIGGRSNVTINTLCDIMTDQSIPSTLDRLAAVNSIILDLSGQSCLSYNYQEMVEELQETSWESPAAEGSRQWTYQTCTEFGFFQTSTKEPQIFDRFPIEFFLEMCQDIYGKKFDEGFVEGAINRTNIFYGGLEIDVSNVVFVHGTVDPWHPLGITESLNEKAPAILINGTAHCANMYPEAEDDLPQLTEARKQVDELIGQWLN